MTIVVLTRGVEAIDLTASIIIGYEAKKRDSEETIEWIVEESADECIYWELKERANFFAPYLNVVVRKQQEIKELCPSTNEIIESLYNILKKAQYESGKIRIQHGSIEVEDECGEKKKYRYFGLDENKHLILYDNKKTLNRLELTQFENLKLAVQGSMNLYFLCRYGKLAHLPWYCIDSEIENMCVDEIIFTPEGCSETIFGTSTMRLLPYGYSVDEYGECANSSTVDTFSRWLVQAGSYVHSRNKCGSNCSQAILQWLGCEVREEIIKKGFVKIIEDIHRSLELPEENIIRLLRIWCLSKIMITYDRGYLEEIRSFGLLDIDGKIYRDKSEILEELINCLENCCQKIYPERVENKDIHYLETEEKPFGKVAKRALAIANDYFNNIFYNLFYTKKATIGNIIEKGGNLENVFNMFDELLDKREGNLTLRVSGSIFEYEE